MTLKRKQWVWKKKYPDPFIHWEIYVRVFSAKLSIYFMEICKIKVMFIIHVHKLRCSALKIKD